MPDFPLNHYDQWLFTLTLLLVLLVVLGAYYYCQRQLNLFKRKEDELDQRYQQLYREVEERKEKLQQSNYSLYEEIEKHEQTEELLKESRHYIQSIINAMPSMLIGVNKEGNVTHWNQAASDKTGIHHREALGRSVFELMDIPGVDFRTVEYAISEATPQYRERVQEGHGSQSHYYNVAVYPLSQHNTDSAVIRVDDVTSRVHLENMIIQNEKMQSLGELAAGIAHEINNPLGAVLQNTQNIQRRLSPSLPANKNAATSLDINLNDTIHYLEERKIYQFLDSVKEAGERAASIVSNMLEFSRSHQQQAVIDVLQLLNRSIELATSTNSMTHKKTGQKISIRKQLPDHCPTIYGSAVELQQVILNLLRNAIQAVNSKIDESTSPLLTIELQHSSKQVTITLKDNGCGMDEWTQQHLFDPFFTTKQEGHGTGLGLSVSYFIIVEHHNGSITVESEPNQGTSFILSFPLYRDKHHPDK